MNWLNKLFDKFGRITDVENNTEFIWFYSYRKNSNFYQEAILFFKKNKVKFVETPHYEYGRSKKDIVDIYVKKKDMIEKFPHMF